MLAKRDICSPASGSFAGGCISPDVGNWSPIGDGAVVAKAGAGGTEDVTVACPSSKVLSVDTSEEEGWAVLRVASVW